MPPHNRIIRNLYWAEFKTEGPPIPQTRLRGKYAKGMTYERKVERWLKRHTPAGTDLRAQPWISFLDAGGRGWARPDFLLVGATAVVLLEAKLSQTSYADAQMTSLYVPLLNFLLPGRPISRVGVFRNLNVSPIRPIESPWELLAAPKELFHTFHLLL